LEKEEKYLGKTLPENIEELKRHFVSEIYREKWFDLFDKIKKNIQRREKQTLPRRRKKNWRTLPSNSLQLISA
jgi:hypothetical protein